METIHNTCLGSYLPRYLGRYCTCEDVHKCFGSERRHTWIENLCYQWRCVLARPRQVLMIWANHGELQGHHGSLHNLEGMMVDTHRTTTKNSTPEPYFPRWSW